MPEKISLTQPDDWHVHCRDGDCLKQTVNATAQHFGRALIMPNLKPALTTVEAVLAYRQRVMQELTTPQTFCPYMTLYLTEHSEKELVLAAKDPFILGAKLYPAGATTHSEEGVHSLKALYPLFDLMAEKDLVLQIHGEVTHGDIFDREALFIEEALLPLVKQFPKLRIVLEHISTRAAVDFVLQAPDTVAATITPHHLLYNRNDLLVGGLHVHYYCLPILKDVHAQKALQQAAVSGNPKFFAGTDSAPHAISNKESACSCAGIYSAPFALSFYTEIFDKLGALSRLNDFMSSFGALFYHLPPNTEKIMMIKKPQLIPPRLTLGDEAVIPMGAGSSLAWSVDEIID